MGVEFSCGPHKTAVLVSDPMARGVSRCSDGQLPEALLVRNRLLQCTVEVGLVPAYKYLGGVVTSDGLPRLEILHRKALAAGIARPLARRFFSNGSIPVETRRTILNALSVSRFVYGSISLHLTCPQHRHIWYQSYLALWRVLSRSDKSTHHKPHACFVLHAARAPSPPLAMAYMRATFLRRLVRHGPHTLMAVLQKHWELCPNGSWLGQLVGDVALVSQYVDGASVLLGSKCIVRALFEALLHDDAWWARLVRKAVRACVLDMDHWAAQLARAASSRASGSQNSSAASMATTADLPFVCRYCGRRFALRKNLCSHELLAHQQWSPVRHYTFGQHCISCFKFWHTARRVQAHLRQDNPCLARAAQLAPPLSHADILEVEAADREREAALRRGNWQKHVAVPPPLRCYGPVQATPTERLLWLDETAMVSDLGQGFAPAEEHVAWIRDYIAARSVEGARQVSKEFWHDRSQHSFRRGCEREVEHSVSPACTFLGHGQIWP